MTHKTKQDDPTGSNNGPHPVPRTPAPAEEPPATASPIQAELDELMDRLKRTTADYQNYQKRVMREMADSRKYANADFAKEMLVIVDDLERAMKVGSGTAALIGIDGGDEHGKMAKAVLDGIRITHEHLMGLLARNGVTAIESLGKPFDPQLHEAMMQQPSGDVEPMTVLVELARGYRMHDRVLRPARVVVSCAVAEKA